jgi:hypothetical protein
MYRSRPGSVETAIPTKTSKPWCAVESAQFLGRNSPHSQRRPTRTTSTSPLIALTSLLPFDQLERGPITPAITRTSTTRRERIYIVRGLRRLYCSHQWCCCLHAQHREVCIIDLQSIVVKSNTFSPYFLRRCQPQQRKRTNLLPRQPNLGHQWCYNLPTAHKHR